MPANTEGKGAVMPSLIEGYVTVPVDPNSERHLCYGCAFDGDDEQTEECADVVCCTGVIFRKMDSK